MTVYWIWVPIYMPIAEFAENYFFCQKPVENPLPVTIWQATKWLVK